MYKDELQQIVERGHAAEQLLNSEAFSRTFSELEVRYFNDWLGSDELSEREQIHNRTAVLRDFKAELTGWITAGEQLQIQMETRHKMSENEEVFNDY